MTLKAPTMEKNAVVEALFLLYGQDYKTGGHQPERRNARWAGTHGYYAFAAGDDADAWLAEDWDDEAYWGQVDDGDGYEAWYDYEDESAEFDQNAVYYYQSEDASDAPDEADFSAMATEFDSVYATYIDARKRLQDLKLSRGFLPVVAWQDGALQSSSPTRSPSKGGYIIPTTLGVRKRGGPTKNVSYNILFFWGGEGDLQKCNLHFSRSLFVGGGLDNLSWIYLTYIELIGHCEPL